MTDLPRPDRAGPSVTADGSPVPVYLAAPPGETAPVALATVPPPATLLELGCGAGRETRPLVAAGYAVTAVDESQQMLAHVTGAEVVEADIFTLDLARRFDVVVAGSHFVDDADPVRRAALLAVCAHHVARGGTVLLERYDPDFAADPQTFSGDVGPVAITFEVLGRAADGATDARLRYRYAGRTWAQEFTFVAATDELVAAEAAAAGLRLVEVLGEDDTWLVLRPT